MRRISEELTRKQMIDPSTRSGRSPQLEKAGWYLRDHSKVKIEIPVDGYDAEPWNGVSDYCLYRENGEVFGFFTREDLENLLYIRQNAKPLSSIEINNEIVDRSYQHEAIRRVGEAFANGKRKALIVMATGTGKTRVTMGLIDVFMRSNQASAISCMRWEILYACSIVNVFQCMKFICSHFETQFPAKNLSYFSKSAAENLRGDMYVKT